jgi:hypothetical protein
MAEQGAPQDPRIVTAEMQMQAKQMDIEDRQQQRQFEMERNEKELQFRQQNLQYNAMREQAEAEQHAIDANLSRELALAKMEADGQMSMEELSRRERIEMIKIQDGRERFNAEAALRINTGAGI